MRLSGSRLLVTAALVAACTEASVPPTALVWSQVPHDETALGGARLASMVDVTVGGPGLVAVGFDGTNDDLDAAVWTSADGISWIRAPADERVLGGEGTQSMASVTVAGLGLVAVGSIGLRGDFDAAVWISGDGMRWSRVPPDEAALGGAGFQSMASVTEGGPGAVAVGSEVTRNDEVAAVWTSADGFVWTRVPTDEALGGDGFQSMASVTVGGPGLVAVGYERLGGDLDAAVWTSLDGLTWQRVFHDEAVLGGEGFQSMASVTVGGPGLVAVGFERLDRSERAAAWTSEDGLIWARVPHNETELGGMGRQEMRSVAATDQGLVAVGYERLGGDLDAVVWTSGHGDSWTRVPHDEAVLGGTGLASMAAITIGGPGLVAVGAEYSRGDRDSAVWVVAKD